MSQTHTPTLPAPRALLIFLLLWLGLTLATLGRAPLFDYDETVYAQTAVDMARTGDYISPQANGQKFYEKPPFVYYLMQGSFAIFGQNSFAARLPSLLFSLATAGLLLWFGRRVHSLQLGLLAATIFLTLLEPALLARAAILDGVLNFFLTAAILLFWLWRREQKQSFALWATLAAGLAVSVKGPVGLVVPLMVVVADRLWGRDLTASLRQFPWLLAIPLLLLAALPWYLLIVATHGWGFLHEFIFVHNLGRFSTPMQGHGGGWHYYLVVFVVSVLPWLFWLFWGCGALRRGNTTGQSLLRLALVWIGLVMLLFTFAQTKLPHYISVVYPAVALALAWAITEHLSEARANRLVWGSLLLTLPVALLLIALPQIAELAPQWIHNPRAFLVAAQQIDPGYRPVVAGSVVVLLLLALAIKVGRYPIERMLAAAWLLHFMLFGFVAPYAAKVIQGPLMQIATLVRFEPAPLYTLDLNVPSVSFYSGRNYTILLGEQGRAQLGTMQNQQYLLLVRNELLPLDEYHLNQRYSRGGYTLFAHPSE